MALRTTYAAQSLAYLNNTHRLPVLSLVAMEVAVIFAKWAERRRTRVALGQLTLTQLDDIGITPHQARHESLKPFWLN